jgi:hypothetical protein
VPATSARRLAAALGALAVVLGASCATTDPSGELTAGTGPGSESCTQPQVTGTGHPPSYPETLDALVADADLVVDARIVGEAGPIIHDGDWQPMTVEVVETFRGVAEDELTVVRLQTTYGVTGTPDTYVGAWNQEPWYCPGERYVLFLDRTGEGGYLALSRQGALRTDPPPKGEAPTALVASLRELDPEALRAEVRAAAARVGP